MSGFRIARLPHGEGLPLPAYQTAQAAGMDIYAAISEDITLPPGNRALIPNGIKLALPPGFEAQIRPRSGLALKHGITVLNSPGTVDADYRGELNILLINHGDADFTVRRGDRIGQLVITRVEHAEWEKVPFIDADETERGSGGYGSTGGAGTYMGEFIVAQKSLVIFDKKVLLLQKSGIIWKEYEGKWELPGGRLEFGESLPEGLAREIQEETGLSVYTDRLLCAAASVPARQKQFVFLFYLSHANTGTVTLSEEHKDFMWATRSQLLELADYSFLQGFSLHELLGDLEID